MTRLAPIRLAVVALALLLWPSSAWADSASIDAVRDAGGGQISVTYTVTSTAVDQSGFSGWFAYLAEDHSTRACSTAWANYLRHVVPSQSATGSVTNTVTFRPFFPRQIKLCVYLGNPAGERPIAEQVAAIPAGYGAQRSSGYNCEDFSRYSAQDYFWLYPGDPSALDADNDGAACEANSGNAPGPQIPAEPSPPPPPPPHDTTCTDGIDNDGDGPLDLNDFDWDTSSYYPAGAKCDQINANPVGGSDDPIKPKPVRLLCNKFVGRRGRNVAYRTRAPRRCAVMRAGWTDSRGLTFIKARWTGWGKATARARVTITAHGFRARARIKAYRLRRDCTGNYRVYTRVALLPSGKRRKTVVIKPDTCPG